MSEIRFDPVSKRWCITGTRNEKKALDYIATRKEMRGHCPFCEGNELETLPEVFAFRKPGTKPNTPGWSVRVIPNKYSVFDSDRLEEKNPGIVFEYRSFNGYGRHEIIIEGPLHLVTLSDLPYRQLKPEQTKEVFVAYQMRLKDFRQDDSIRYGIIFKNHGYEISLSQPHPHSQLMGLPFIPRAIREELCSAKEYYDRTEKCIFCDMIKEELNARSRIVVETEYFLAYAPFASRIPFEVHVYPKRHCSDYVEAQEIEIIDLARLINKILLKICKLLKDPPFNYTIHTMPFIRAHENHWKTILKDYHWHIEIVPHAMPARGLEWGVDTFLDPPTPEISARFLREVEI